MSEKPEIELDLDLQLLPAWARQPQTVNRYANFEGAGEGDRRGPRDRGPGRDRGRDFRGDRRPDFRGPRPAGPPDRPGPGRPDDARGQRPRGDRPDRGERRPDDRRPEPVEDLPEGITVGLVPDPAGVDSLAKQIRQTGRAYPLFDIAHLILKRPDRYQLHFKAHGNHADGSPRQFYLCNLDDTVWMTEAEAMRHVLTKHFATFYQTEKIAIDPPKGTYTFVAQCGMSGVILGPPNLHDYQAKLQRLHAERYSRLPFDVYKSRVRIVRDEAVVKQWIEDQSFKFEYVCLNVPEPQKLESRDAVERHFREVHLPNIFKPATSHSVRTPAAREALPGPLRRLSRREFELQQRFPLPLVTRLSDEFAHRGLHFFKVNKTVLHVAVARPRFLDMETNPVSDGVRRIVESINKIPGCTRRKLLEALGVTLPPADAPADAASEAPPSPELSAIIGDLHWLIHEGHVIEFANGRLETAKKPAPRPTPPPRPPRPPVNQASTPAAAPATTAGQATTATTTVESPEAGDAAEAGPETSEASEEAVPAESESDTTAAAEPIAGSDTPTRPPGEPSPSSDEDTDRINPS